MTTLEKLEELIYTGFKETDEKWRETDKKWRETDRKLQESDVRFRAWLEESFKKMEALLHQFSKETDRKIGEMTGKWSHFVEGLVAPAVVRMFSERGIIVTDVARHVESQRGDEGIEIDIFAKNGEYAILIEAKRTLSIDGVNEHLERMSKFSRFFPEYKNLKAIGAVAGIVIAQNVAKFAYRKGLFVIAQSGDTVKILNDEQFKPRVWTLEESSSG